MKTRILILVLSLLLGLLGFQNCSKPVAFSKDTSLGSEEVLGNPNGNPDDTPDDPNKPPHIVQESVEVRYTNNVDVLIVMDNSKSMTEEQQSMASRFSNFINKLNGLNWNLGIITTDARSGAELRDGNLIKFAGGSDYFLKSNMSASYINTAFSGTIQMGANGSGLEQGIAVTSRFIDHYSEANNPVRNMIRDDAALSVILVTDSDESASGSINNGDNLIAKIKTKFGNAKRFIYNSIVIKSGDTACLPLGEVYGKKYEALSKATGGVIGSVCATDYSAQLQNIGEVTAQSINSIQLKCVPVDMNNNGSIMDDVVIKNGSTVVTGYTIVGQQARFGTGLPDGTYSVSYYCK